MSEERQETIDDIVDDIRAQNQGLPEDSYALSPLVCDFLSIADRIEAAAKREKAKPVRNCEKYKTAKGALAGFNEMCDGKTCYRCPFSAERNDGISCRFNWLYAVEEKEEAK